MHHRFVLKIWLLILLTVVPYLLIVFCFGIPFIIYTNHTNDGMFGSEILGISLALFTLIGMLIYEFYELRFLFWMLLNYEQNRDQVLHYLRSRCEQNKMLDQIKQNAFRYRPSLKHLLYEDLLHVLEDSYC